ncbi:neurexophilin and pc-esterase domain family, member 3 [Plakobranchus ocellatus]|uniref:Neurexophilin and pc-esterase domain family, member 3 n=1 Tax=Plakobranchus ocellatus TaxID=259542 RepID=A0AAV4CIY2_9GAST|nr:neurexophilin and pc-esterase domain family, member 3 [Plakobranchus ocellatus]
MGYTLYKKLGACALLGFLLCYVILSICFGPNQESSPKSLLSRVISWSFGKDENVPFKVLRSIAENVTWHGRPLLANLSTHLWFTENEDLKLLAEGLVSGGLNISSLAEYSITSLPPDAIELRLLHDPPLLDPLMAANETMSRVVILGSDQTYSVNDQLHIRLDVFDGYGNPLSRGNDQIRVWAIDSAQQASLATEVNDLGNGSYFASIPLLWPGNLQVKVSLTYNREVLRAISFVKVAVRTTKFMAAGFFSEFGNTATLCSTYPYVPGGYDQLCDLSKSNGGMPWFCGKPRNSALSCNHWTHVTDIQFVQPLPLTKAEQLWMKWLDIPKNLRLVKTFKFQHDLKKFQRGIPSIDVRSSPPKSNLQPKILCSERTFEDSWRDVSPRGYWLKQAWTPFACTMPLLSAPRVVSCLRDMTVLLLGDSNLRLVLAILKKMTGCVLDTGGEVNPKWHRPMRCINKNTKTEIRWRTHAQPFHTSQQEWGDRKDQKAVNEYIDEVPDEANFIIVVHLYLHFTTELLDVYRIHIRAIRASIERLLLRNPLAKVVIRAPHSASQFWPTIYSTDSFAWAFSAIIKTEFRGLYDKVLFIQPWDMTVAAENIESHPPDYVNKAILNLILSHLC